MNNAFPWPVMGWDAMGNREISRIRARKHQLEKRLQHLEYVAGRQQEEIERLREEVRCLEEENRCLRTALNQRAVGSKEGKSGMSSRPSIKPNIPGSRRKRGPPRGHKGFSRPLPGHVDEEVLVELEKCPDCGSELEDPRVFVSHTVEDIVLERRTVVRRYHQGRQWCPGCKRRVLARAPLVLRNTPFGPQMTMLMTTMRLEGLPVSTIQRHLKRWWGMKISEATILEIMNRVASELRPIYKAIQEQVQESKYVNSDETGWRIQGINHWLWVFDSPEAVLFRIDRSRGSKVPKSVLGEDYQGIVECDGYAAYTPLDYLKQQCLIHINRDLRKVEARHGIVPRPLLVKKDPIFIRPGRPPAEFLTFADSVRKILRDAVEKWGKGPPYPTHNHQAAKKYKHQLKKLVDQPYRDKDCKRIAKSLKKRIDEIFTFVKHPGIPWHNNNAERALRPSVATRKISYGNQSKKGAETHTILRSVHDTWTKQNIDFIDQAMRLLGSSPMPQT
jgi:transposase